MATTETTRATLLRVFMDRRYQFLVLLPGDYLQIFLSHENAVAELKAGGWKLVGSDSALHGEQENWGRETSPDAVEAFVAAQAAYVAADKASRAAHLERREGEKAHAGFADRHEYELHWSQRCEAVNLAEADALADLEATKSAVLQAPKAPVKAKRGAA